MDTSQLWPTKEWRQQGLVVVLLVAAATMQACTSRSSVNLPADPQIAGAISAFVLTSAENIPIANFSYDPSGRAYFSSQAFRVQGSCYRGAANVLLSINGVSTTTFPCTLASAVDYTYQAPSDGSYNLIFTPVGFDGTSAGQPYSLRAFIKTTNPPPPVILEHSPLFAEGYVTLHGTFSNLDSNKIGSIVVKGATGSMAMNMAAGTFTYSFSTSTGTTYNLSFQAKDYAGNLSTAVPFEIFTKSILALNTMGGAAVDSVTSQNQLAAFSSAPFMIAPKKSRNNLYMGVPAGAAEGP